VPTRLANSTCAGVFTAADAGACSSRMVATMLVGCSKLLGVCLAVGKYNQPWWGLTAGGAEPLRAASGFGEFVLHHIDG